VVIGGILVFCFAVYYVGSYLFDAATGGYWHFLKRDQRYYSEFARACDSILAQHPVGTNLFIRIPVTDVSVPLIIQNLHPAKIGVESNRVDIVIGDSRAGFGIVWEQPFDAPTNVWALDTYAESLLRTAYVQTNR